MSLQSVNNQGAAAPWTPARLVMCVVRKDVETRKGSHKTSPLKANRNNKTKQNIEDQNTRSKTERRERRKGERKAEKPDRDHTKRSQLEETRKKHAFLQAKLLEGFEPPSDGSEPSVITATLQKPDDDA